MLKTQAATLLGCALLPTLAIQAGQYAPPPLMLASEYRNELRIDQYLVSEKLDGIRAYWDGRQLLTRSGNLIQTPAWFTQGFPQIPLDGELWLGRGQFEAISALVRSTQKQESLWRNVRFMVFDLPVITAPFEMRYQQLLTLLEQTNRPQLRAVTQFNVPSEKALMALLQRESDAGAEGLMLRLKNGLYEPKRSHQLLKLKLWQDAEAQVIGHQPGQGQFEGVLGALLVENEQGKIFKIGTGFNLPQRQTPPPIGSIVTYRYRGKTSSGIPRFASFLRVRKEL